MSDQQNGGAETPARFDTDLYEQDRRQGYNLTAVDDEDMDDQLDAL